MGRFESAIGVLGCKARSRHATCWLALARCGRCRAVRSRGVVSRGGHGLYLGSDAALKSRGNLCFFEDVGIEGFFAF
jgi:hypothetical protein